MQTRLRRYLCGSRWLLAFALAAAPVSQAAVVDVAYQIKASYIFNFLQFVHFPETSLQSDGALNVCILGEDRFGSALSAIEGATIPKGHVKVLSLGRYSTASELERCKVLYLIDSERQGVDEIMGKINSQQVLTIGEFSPFIRHGGLIELFEHNDTIRFRINKSLINKTGFKIDAQLIQLGSP